MRTTTKLSLAICLVTLINTSPLQAVGNRLAPSADADAPQPPKAQTACPVMGGPIDKGLYVDVKGKRIYLCCAACEDAIRAEPDKYIKKIEKRGETVEDVPK